MILAERIGDSRNDVRLSQWDLYLPSRITSVSVMQILYQRYSEWVDRSLLSNVLDFCQ